MMLLLALLLGAARQPIGVYQSWGAFREGPPLRCFALAEPVRRGRTHPFASVTTRPNRGVRNQIAFQLSTAVRADTPVTLGIDDRRFALIAEGDHAWAPDARTDAAIVAAMRSARSMSVSAVTASGRPFADTYALGGAATAIDAAALACVSR
ncbi:hypothetical protein EAH87_05645 [Sphingomonas koreensis]|nr:hypothetical protein EAH87_05645 [Sphingomonas koreensis]